MLDQQHSGQIQPLTPDAAMIHKFGWGVLTLFVVFFVKFNLYKKDEKCSRIKKK